MDNHAAFALLNQKRFNWYLDYWSRIAKGERSRRVPVHILGLRLIPVLETGSDRFKIRAFLR